MGATYTFRSGGLLEAYCSSEECKDPQMLWFWIFVSAAPFPFLLALLRHWIGSHDHVRMANINMARVT